MISVELDGRAVLYHRGSQRARSLNSTGTIVWALLDRLGTLDELADALAEEFGVELEAARAEIHAFVEDLRRRRFVEHV